MPVQQAGIYTITLYENKGFSFSYKANGKIDATTITNTGDTITIETNHNKPKLENEKKPGKNNIVLNNNMLKFELQGLTEANFQTIEQIRSSIYGWIPVIEFMDKQKYLIKEPFFNRVGDLNSQVSHTFFIDLTTPVNTKNELIEIED